MNVPDTILTKIKVTVQGSTLTFWPICPFGQVPIYFTCPNSQVPYMHVVQNYAIYINNDRS